MFGCPVLSGPHVFNFKDIFHQLDTEQAVLWCDSDSQLAGQLSLLLDQPELRQRLSKTGKALFEQQAGATQRTLTQLGNLLGTRANHYKVRKQAGVEICWDSEAIKTPSGLAFEQSHWQNTNQIIGSSSGRNTAWFIQHQDKKMVLRHYYRGGLIGKLIKRSFFYAPSSKCRSFKEFRLLQRMVAEGLPVPNPIAALYRRTWLGYQASILIELLPEAQDLCHHLMAQPLSDEQWQVVGKAIAKMHNKQVFHSDLNCHNILLNKQSKVFLIDFDKCDYRAGDSWKADNLSRLLRSLNKEKGIHRPFYFSDSNWQLLLDGYHTDP